MLERRFRRLRLAALREMPAEQFAAPAVCNTGQDHLAVEARPDAAHVCGPAFVGAVGRGDPGFDPGPESDRPLAHLPALDLEDPLHGVLVHVEQMHHGPIAERRVLLDHRRWVAGHGRGR